MTPDIFEKLLKWVEPHIIKSSLRRIVACHSLALDSRLAYIVVVDLAVETQTPNNILFN